MGSWAAWICWAALAAPGDTEVDAAVERVLAADRYQKELPLDRVPDAPVQPERPARRETRVRDPAPSRDGLRPVGSALLWIFVGALGIAVAFWLAREVGERRRARVAIGAPAAPEAAPAAPRLARVPDHEVLARAGRFADAIHAILIGALAALGRAHAGMRPAWTSREIVGLVKLEATALGALRSLVGLVEVTRFGGKPAREEEYREALSWFGSIGPGGVAASLPPGHGEPR